MFLTEMYNAAMGIQPEPPKRGVAEVIQVSSRDSNKFKIFFPSQNTVRESRGGAGYRFPRIVAQPSC